MLVGFNRIGFIQWVGGIMAASACIACAACAAACDANAIRIFIDEDEGLLVWTLDLFDCTHCGRCAGIMPGRDVPAALKEADSWFREHAFF